MASARVARSWENSSVRQRPLPLLAVSLLFVLSFGACRPAVEPEEHPGPTAGPTSAEPVLPLDAETPREIVLGKLFAPDGSIQSGDRTASFAPGAPILLSIESGDLPPGTPVTTIWTSPDGATTEQKTVVIGGESYLTYTAPSKSWPARTGRASVRIGEGAEKSSGVDLPFEFARNGVR